jgi:hypothetical protein
MDIIKAKEIVEMLADGIDPTTGEILPLDSHYNDPEIIRALFTVLRSVRMPAKASKKSIKEKQKENIENGRPKNAGLPWTEEQRKEISSLLIQGKTIVELSEHFERTEGAITSELTHQGLIE